MTHEILKILDTTELQELEKQRITTDLLRLFNIAERSEHLLAVAEYVYDHFDDSSRKTAKDYLQDFLSQ